MSNIITITAKVAAKFVREGEYLRLTDGTELVVTAAGYTCPMSGEWIIPGQNVAGEMVEYAVDGPFAMVTTVDTMC